MDVEEATMPPELLMRNNAEPPFTRASKKFPANPEASFIPNVVPEVDHVVGATAPLDAR